MICARLMLIFPAPARYATDRAVPEPLIATRINRSFLRVSRRAADPREPRDRRVTETAAVRLNPLNAANRVLDGFGQADHRHECRHSSRRYRATWPGVIVTSLNPCGWLALPACRAPISTRTAIAHGPGDANTVYRSMYRG